MTLSTPQNTPSTTSLTLAKRAFRTNGAPYSPVFDDIYHSVEGAFEQAEHVFIHGNDLPARWIHSSSTGPFIILETGFGLGVNFLATWAAWRQTSNRRNTRLHIVSIEKHPFTRDDLRELLLHIAPSSLRPLIHELCQQWPVLTPGLHRLEFDAGQVVLTLCLGDIHALLPQLQFQAHAIYLDGFSPDKNPEMWTAKVCNGIACLAAKQATLATYTVAGAVRKSLIQAGFEVYKALGFKKKRSMLMGHFAPKWKIRRSNPIKSSSYGQSHKRHALVIGAGLAGCSISHVLTQRGWEVSLLEQHGRAAQHASGISLGLFHPVITLDASLLARASRAGFLLALQHFKKLCTVQTECPLYKATGLLKIAKNEEEASLLYTQCHQLAFPEDFAVPVTQQEASLLAGSAVPYGGWYFPQGGWACPAALCHAQLSQAGPALKTYFGQQVAQLTWNTDEWHAVDVAGRIIAHAPIVILANAQNASSLLALLGTHIPPTQTIRGQLTTLRFPASHTLHLPLIGDGHIAQLPHSTHTELLIGASYDRDNLNRQPDLQSHQGNLARFTKLLPNFGDPLIHGAIDLKTDLNPDTLLHEQVAFRCASRDRLPLLGAIFQEKAWQPTEAGAHLNDLPRFPGLYGAWAYGSRGLIWASLGAEYLAAQLEGEPLPIERSILAALDPARFFLRQFRHSSSIQSASK